ncbi:MAG: hypothetical protein ACRCY8_19310 [Dermatophilaceae bacterium]
MTQPVSARTAYRAQPRRTTGSGRRLRVVAPPASRGNGWFFLVCATLLLGGTLGVLVLNTTMAKGAYTMRDLQRRSDELADTQDALRQSVQGVSGPGPLARRARELGMVPAGSAAFLRLSDGAVLGVPQPAVADQTFRVVTEPSAPAAAARPPAPSTTRPSPSPSGGPPPSASPSPSSGPPSSGAPSPSASPTPSGAP